MALELRALGGLSLRGAESAQPKRLAFLCYLTLAGTRGFHRRDSLVALFWPELDEAHARQSLRQALTAIRALDDRLVVTRSEEEVGVAPGALACDVMAFEQAVAQGELVTALEIYAGPFLDGFFLSDCPEFERWVEGERARLSALAADAAWKLADQEPVPAAAVQWARRAAGLQPDDEGALRRLVSVLDRAGDRSGALREYEAFARRLREQYQAEPAPETRALVAAVRLRGEPGGAVGAGVSVEAMAPPFGQAVGSAHPDVAPGWRRPVLVAAIVGGLIVAAVAGYVAVNHRGGAGSAQVSSVPRLAVLPFENLGRPEDEFFADGMTEEITSRLARVEGLGVIGRTSAMQYKGGGKPLRTVGAELNVQYVLEGSVRWSGLTKEGRVRITSQLIRVADETHVWADEYDAVLTDVFAVQGKIADQVVAALGAALGRGTAVPGAEPPTRNPEAYEQYLRGNALYAQCLLIPCLRAVEAGRHYEEAVRLDSNFAAAWARLALAMMRAGVAPGAPPPERAQEAATRALALAPQLPDAYVAEGWLYYNETAIRDFARAEAPVRRALELQPNHAEALILMGSLQQRSGQTEAAADFFQRLAELDPRDESAQFWAGTTNLRLRRWDEAEKYLQRYATLAPTSPSAGAQLKLLHLMRSGDTAAARRIVVGGRPSGFYSFLGFTQLFGFLCSDCERAARAELARPRPPGVDSLDWHPYMSRGIIAQLAGDSAVARANLDSAARMNQAAMKAGGRDNLHVHHDRAALMALLGRKDAALREANELVQLDRTFHDGMVGPAALTTAAEVYARFGEDQRAIDLLDRVLAMPSYVTVPLVRVNPVWQRFRDNPRFQAVLARHER